MGEISADTDLGRHIVDIVKDLNLRTNLDIGAWDGTGATECFIEGMKDFPDKSLTCLEIEKKKYDALVKNVKKYPWVNCHNTSSIDCDKLVDFGFKRIWESPFNPLIRFASSNQELTEQWYNEDVSLMKKFPSGFLEKDKTMYDAVLIDGSEFTGFFEFNLLKDRTNVFFLDDTFGAYKTCKAAAFLQEDLEWECIAYKKNVEEVDWGLGISPEQVYEVGMPAACKDANHLGNLTKATIVAIQDYDRSVRNGFAIFKRKVFLEHEK